MSHDPLPADSDRGRDDSNSSSRWQATAHGNRVQRSNIAWRRGAISGPKNGRSFDGAARPRTWPAQYERVPPRCPRTILLKTIVAATSPWVRIPRPPLLASENSIRLDLCPPTHVVASSRTAVNVRLAITRWFGNGPGICDMRRGAPQPASAAFSRLAAPSRSINKNSEARTS